MEKLTLSKESEINDLQFRFREVKSAAESSKQEYIEHIEHAQKELVLCQTE